MARPNVKSDLISSANVQFEKMWDLIGSLGDPDSVTLEFGDISNKKEAHWARDKNLRDILIHLYEWHQLLLVWVEKNQGGEKKPFLPEPYTWKTYGQMNILFWEKHQNTTYEQAVKLQKESHDRALALADTFSNDELFTKKHFDWTGSTNLGSYFISALPSHYDWAIKKIKAHIKALNA